MSNANHDGLFSRSLWSGRDAWSFKEDRLCTIPEIRIKLRRLTAEMVIRGYEYLDVFSVRWAVGEALLNAIQHGHRGDKTKTVRLCYVIDQEYVLAEVTDEGPGFNPNEVPNPFATPTCQPRAGDVSPLVARRGDPPSKKGLFMMRLFMSWVRFEGKGNRVTLCKIRTPPKRLSRLPLAN